MIEKNKNKLKIRESILLKYYKLMNKRKDTKYWKKNG